MAVRTCSAQRRRVRRRHPRRTRVETYAVEAINAGLRSMKAGHGTLGKVAVIVDRDLAGEK
jgi:hypothetical protein